VVQISPFQNADTLFQLFHITDFFPDCIEHRRNSQQTTKPEFDRSYKLIDKKIKVSIKIKGRLSIQKIQRIGMEIGFFAQRAASLTVNPSIVNVCERRIIEDYTVFFQTEN